MGFEIMLIPNSLNGHATESVGLSHTAHTPVSGVVRLGMKSRLNHRVNLPVGNFRNTARTRSVLLQASKSVGQKTLPPQLHGRPRRSHLPSDVLTQNSVGRHSNNLGSLHQAQRKTFSMRPGIQGFLLFGRYHDGFRESHV